MTWLWTSRAYLGSLAVLAVLAVFDILEELPVLVAIGASMLSGYFIVIAANWLSARDRLAADTVEHSNVLHPPQVATVARSLRTSAVILAILAAWMAVGAFS